MSEESFHRGHVVHRRLAGDNVVIKSFPTYEEAKEYAKKKYDAYVSGIPGREVELGGRGD